jgi:hypothetical protein
MDRIDIDAIQITTKEGVAQYPSLNAPNTRFDDDGVYKVNLILEQEDGDELSKQLTEYRDRAASQVKKGKKPLSMANLPFEPETDKDTDEPTGRWIFKFKMNATYKDKQGKIVEVRPNLFGPDLKPTKANIGGGSRLCVAAKVFPWLVPSLGLGISLRLQAVQVIEAMAYGGDASSYEFRAREVETPEEVVETSSEGGSYDF